MEAKPRPATTAALPSGAKTREDQVAPANRTAGELLQALATRQISSRELSTTRLRASSRLIQ
jgi:hypothetical protein